MNFSSHMLPITKDNCFRERGFYVWCGSITKENDRYYLFYSRWPKSAGMSGWVVCSEICLASSSAPCGPYKHECVLFTKQDAPAWDRDCFHNPCVLSHDGKYYLYYMGNYGKGDFWSHRNNQRIGVATADSVFGEWKRFEKPVLDVSDEGFDSLMTANPTVTKTPDGKFIMMYKAVDKEGKMPVGGAVICGTAISDRPEGPFVKTNMPIMVNPENPWSVEDPCIWYDGERFCCLAKDFQGFFTKTNSSATALFVSENGLTDYFPDAENPLAFARELHLEDGSVQPVANMERPQIYSENGKPTALCCAVATDPEWNDTFNVQIPLAF